MDRRLSQTAPVRLPEGLEGVPWEDLQVQMGLSGAVEGSTDREPGAAGGDPPHAQPTIDAMQMPPTRPYCVATGLFPRGSVDAAPFRAPKSVFRQLAEDLEKVLNEENIILLLCVRRCPSLAWARKFENSPRPYCRSSWFWVSHSGTVPSRRPAHSLTGHCESL